MVSEVLERQSIPCNENNPEKLKNCSRRLYFATWNVRTLLDRETSDRPDRRTAFVARELTRLDIDIAALSETRLADEGQLQEDAGGFTFFWKGLPQEDRRIHGVGFAIRNSLLKDLEEIPTGVNERLMTLRLKLSNRQNATVISCYAPTLTAEDKIKEKFYEDLENILKSIPTTDKIILLGDFNARVGRDAAHWNGTIGKNGVGNANSNGLLLLSLCTRYELVITNTLFRLKNKYKTTWCHPRSKHWHLLDYVIVRSKDRHDVRITRTMRGADECWTDHRLVRSTMNISLKKRVRKGPKITRRKFNTHKLLLPSEREMFQSDLHSRLSQLEPTHQGTVDEQWATLKNVLLQTCKSTIGLHKRVSEDWFDENDSEIKDLIDRKRQAFVCWQDDYHNIEKHKRFTLLKAEVQTRVRDMKNTWWEAKAQELQAFADRHDMRNFFQATKALYGPTKSGLAPLKSEDGSILHKDEASIKARALRGYRGGLYEQPPWRSSAELLHGASSVASLVLLPTRHDATSQISVRRTTRPTSGWELVDWTANWDRSDSLPNFYMEEITDADLDEIFGPMEVEEQTLEATPETEVSRVRFACLNEQQLGEIEEGRVEKTTECSFLECTLAKRNARFTDEVMVNRALPREIRPARAPGRSHFKDNQACKMEIPSVNLTSFDLDPSFFDTNATFVELESDRGSPVTPAVVVISVMAVLGFIGNTAFPSFPLGESGCKAVVYFPYFGSVAVPMGVLSLVLNAATQRVFRALCPRWVVYTALLFIWVVAIHVPIPAIVHALIIIYGENLFICRTVWPGDPKMYDTVIFALFYALPALMLLAFCIVIIAVRRQATGPAGPQEGRRTDILIIIMAALFVVMYLPFYVAHLCFSYGSGYDTMALISVSKVGQCLVYLNSALKPLLCACLYDRFRSAFIRGRDGLAGGTGDRGTELGSL
ncbi:hypothetical protein Bbelb_141930 [Branchiostoma belcheri]|nr:hypothetical protein Bbelb_141930 [Branchiostoma belcheri]